MYPDSATDDDADILIIEGERVVNILSEFVILLGRFLKKMPSKFILN